MKLWDLQSGDKLSSIEVGPVDIWTVVFSPDDKFIVSGSHAGKIHLYGTESGKQEQTLDTRGGKFTLSVAYVSHLNKSLNYVMQLLYMELHFRVLMVNILQVVQLTGLLISLMLPMEKFCVH